VIAFDREVEVISIIDIFYGTPHYQTILYEDRDDS
jgi:hypothetical protein